MGPSALHRSEVGQVSTILCKMGGHCTGLSVEGLATLAPGGGKNSWKRFPKGDRVDELVADLDAKFLDQF